MTSDSSGGMSGSGIVGWISTYQKIFGGHGAGSGSMASRAGQQIAYQGFRLAQQQAALENRRFRESQAGPAEFAERAGSPLAQIRVDDPLPVRLSSRLTRAQQLRVRATTPHQQRQADEAVRHANALIAHYRKVNPEAYNYAVVQRRA